VFNLIPGSRSTLVATVGIHEPGGGVDVDNIHERESMLFVLSGEFAIAFANREPMRIRRGEGAILHSIAPYRVWNVSKRVGRILAIAARSATTP
jgi:mannose-6-phosphate isomerase-like protein (cupin superfamily)